jgi:inosose dehydratase
LEPHGPVTDSVEAMRGLLEALGHAQTVGLCLDTGNCWLGGGDPVEFARCFGPRIKPADGSQVEDNWSGTENRT